MAKKTQYSDKHRQQLVSAWQRSGLSQAEFAAKHGVRPTTFNRWTHVFATSFVEVSVTNEMLAPSADFEVTLNSGDHILVPSIFDPAALRAVIQAVRC